MTQSGESESHRLIMAHRELIGGQRRIRIGVGDHLALSLSLWEAAVLVHRLAEFDELLSDLDRSDSE